MALCLNYSVYSYNYCSTVCGSTGPGLSEISVPHARFGTFAYPVLTSVQWLSEPGATKQRGRQREPSTSFEH